MKAIRGETGSAGAAVRTAPAIHGTGLCFRLALRQLLTERRKYVSACAVAVRLVFFASLVGRMDAWLGPDGKGMMDAFNPADWRLPIYHYDDYEGWESFQYYDIPSRYEIPSNAETVTSEKAGEVYYSEPNRIVMFYHDGEISGDYTLVGHFDLTEEFVSAVENNPVLEGWGNKIVQISAED